MRQDSGFAPAYYWLGVASRQLGELGEATAAFRRYLTLDADGEHAGQARDALASLDRD